VNRSFGHLPPNTPQARRKAQVAGSFIAVAAALDLVATMIAVNGTHRVLITVLYAVATVMMLGGVVYILTNRKAV
jgi:hypothetical protein